MLNITYSTFNDSPNRFEDFVCCLAYSLKPENAKENSFVNLNGKGGDGGVECYWILNDDTTHAYQAKYFNKLDYSQQDQIEKSFKTACETFPNLTRYDVYTSLDGFTSSRGNKKGSLEKKNTLLAKLKAEKDIEINLYSLAEANTFIVDNNLIGITNYFTNSKLFTPQWFKDKSQDSIVALGERFTPEKHISTEAEEMLGLLLQNKAFEEKLYEKLQTIRGLNYYRKNIKFNENVEVIKLHNDISNAIKELLSFADNYNSFNKFSFNLSSITTILNEIVKNIRVLEEKAIFYEIYKSDYSNIFQNALSDVKSIKHLLYLFYGDGRFDFNKNLIILQGHPGMGKSHLLAKLMLDLAEEERPTIFLLGASLNQNIEESILSSLDCNELSFEKFLKTLDIAALSSGKAAIIFIDAINESSTLAISDSLPTLLNKIGRFRNIKLVVSCRSDFRKLYIRDDLIKKSNLIKLSGFVRYVDRETAMEVYFDKENKERPFFSYEYPIGQIPLFIKLLSNMSVGTNGASGIIELLKSYINAISNNIAKKYDTLPEYVEQSVFDIAIFMAKNKTQSISVKDARLLIKDAFGGMVNPPSSSLHWADILCDEYVLRKEFDYTKDDFGNFNKKYAFQFQTITSYLLVASIIKKIDNFDDIFSSGNFDFLLIENGILNYYFIDLFKALAVFIPEKFRGKEIYDCLPNNIDNNSIWDVDRTFLESLTIRNSLKETFSDSTIKQINRLLQERNSDVLEVLIKFSITKNNPFNALFLNNFLKSKTTIERDSYWTEHLSIKIAPIDIEDRNYSEYSYDLSSIEIILERIEFCTDISSLDTSTIELTSLVLCWGLTSTSRILRDRITRVLVKIYLEKPSVFIDNLHNFKDVEDLYILERILSAAYGAVLIDDNLALLQDWSIEIYNIIFANNTPPSHLILRNNARQIIEIANKKTTLNKSINMEFVRPPYNTKINLLIKNRERKYFQEKYGDIGIYDSCLDDGDFGKYKVDRKIKKVSNISLSKDQPMTNEDKFKFFKNEILILWDREKQKEFETIDTNSKKIKDLKRNIDFSFGIDITKPPPSYLRKRNPKEEILEDIFIISHSEKEENELRNKEKEFRKKLKKFKESLSISEGNEFRKFASPNLLDIIEKKEYKHIDNEKAKLWITQNAYKMGFSREFSQNDIKIYPYSDRGRPLIERIGKKYQWIAFYDLLARLTDNYWIFNENEFYEYKFKRYDIPRDLDILEDIDPSIQIDKLESDSNKEISFINYKSLIGIDVDKWIDNSYPEDSYQSENYIRVKYNNDNFLVLYSYLTTNNKNDVNSKKDLEQWNRLNSYIVDNKDTSEFLNVIRNKRLEDPDFSHPPHDYQTKIYEYINGYADINYKNHINHRLENFEAETTTFQVNDDGNIIDIKDSYNISEYILNLKIRENLNLQSNPKNIREFLNIKGELIFKTFHSKINSTTVAIIREEDFLKFLARTNKTCVWVSGGEKLLLSNTEMRIDKGRTSNIIYTSNGDKIKMEHNSYRDFFKQRDMP